MTAEQREQLNRWIEAYLDGRLTDEQSAQFAELLKRSPSVRAEIELQTEIDHSLRRLFSPPTAVKAPETSEVVEGSTKRAESVKGPRKLVSKRVWAFATAASLLILVGFGWQIWQAFYGDSADPAPHLKKLTLTEAYRAAEQEGFKAAWLCKDEREFATTFHWQLGQALAMAPPPKGIVAKGISYVRLDQANAFNVVQIITEVGGDGVIVFVDKRKSGGNACLKVEPGLRVFVKETEHLLLREVTPLDLPMVLDLLEEREIPDEWKKDPPGYSNSGAAPGSATPGDEAGAQPPAEPTP